VSYKGSPGWRFSRQPFTALRAASRIRWRAIFREQKRIAQQVVIASTAGKADA
jgi:hypothetical protein